MAATERIYVDSDCAAWRDGDWVIVTLGGRVVLRRLTRDREFTHAELVFHEYQSPPVARTQQNFSKAVLAGSWRSPRRSGYNRIRVPIHNSKPVNNTTILKVTL